MSILAVALQIEVVDPPELGDGPDDGCLEPDVSVAAPDRRPLVVPPRSDGLPTGRAIAALSERECLAILDRRAIGYERAEGEGIAIPIRLTAPIGGIRIDTAERGVHDRLDCRLAVALLAWAPVLRAHEIRAIEHYSMYRPGARVRGSRRVSGHARGLAIDLARLTRDDGTEVDVLAGWQVRTRGADPCAAYDEAPPSASMRAAICASVDADLFQIVLTPHYDAAHGNHVHLELVPDVDWTFLH